MKCPACDTQMREHIRVKMTATEWLDAGGDELAKAERALQ